MKLTKEEFWNITSEEKTDYGVMLRTNMPVCKYGQAYKKDIKREEYKKRYLKFYYRLYLIDFESNELKNKGDVEE